MSNPKSKRVVRKSSTECRKDDNGVKLVQHFRRDNRPYGEVKGDTTSASRGREKEKGFTANVSPVGGQTLSGRNENQERKSVTINIIVAVLQRDREIQNRGEA